MKGKNKSKGFEVEITQAEHKQMIAEGADPEYALKPGKHRFRRGGFLERHPDFDPKRVETKVRVTMYLDADIVEYFKRRATQPDAAPYQTQINSALRQVIEHTSGQDKFVIVSEDFLNQVASRVKEMIEAELSVD